MTLTGPEEYAPPAKRKLTEKQRDALAWLANDESPDIVLLKLRLAWVSHLTMVVPLSIAGERWVRINLDASPVMGMPNIGREKTDYVMQVLAKAGLKVEVRQ